MGVIESSSVVIIDLAIFSVFSLGSGGLSDSPPAIHACWS
jgi:hypothetical protein